MTTTKAVKASDKQQPVKMIRSGAIAASIWKRQTATGFEYLEFSLSRSWRLKNGEKDGYSQNFFENNEPALREVITAACEFIRAHELAQAERRVDSVSKAA